MVLKCFGIYILISLLYHSLLYHGLFYILSLYYTLLSYSKMITYEISFESLDFCKFFSIANDFFLKAVCNPVLKMASRSIPFTNIQFSLKKSLVNGLKLISVISTRLPFQKFSLSNNFKIQILIKYCIRSRLFHYFEKNTKK